MKVINKILNGITQVYIAFLSGIPTEIGIKIRYLAYKRLFKKSKGIFRIDSGVTIRGFKNIELGENIRFEKNSYIYAINANLKVGDNFFLGVNSQLCAVREDIIIGDYCMIAPNCIFVSDDHCFDSIESPMMEQGFNVGKIVLKNDIWIGANSVILKDIVIGEGSIIGAGSIVTKNIKPYSIMGGVPAKLIKKREFKSND